MSTRQEFTSKLLKTFHRQLQSLSRFQQTQGDSPVKDRFVENNCFYCDITMTPSEPEHFRERSLGYKKSMLIQMQSPKVPCNIYNKEFESEGSLKLQKIGDHQISILDLN